MKIKKILVYLAVILLVVKSPLVVYAESTPGTVTVSGGSIGSGGIEGNSNILKGTALTVVMATLASAGITVKLAAEDYAKGNTAINYLEDKFAEWESNSSQAWDIYNNYRALNDTKVDSQGNLYIPEAASNVMQKFLNWLFANDAVNELPSQGTAGGAYPTLYGSAIDVSDGCGVVTSSDVYFLAMTYNMSSQYRLGMFSDSPFTCYWHKGTSSGTQEAVFNNAYAGGKYVLVAYGDKIFYPTVPAGMFDCKTAFGFGGYDNQWKQFFRTYGQGVEVPDTPGIGQTGFYGETLDIPQLVDESGNGKILIVQPGLIGSVQDSYVGSNNASIDIQDYLDALKDLYGQQAIPQEITDLPDISIPGEDVITGTKEEVAVIDRDLVLAPDITVPADPGAITWPEVPEAAVPLSDPSVPADPEVSIPAMSVDLTKIFPFCIPWDLYNLLSKFNADPVTPSVTINWGNILGSIGVNFTTTLDLHDYDNVALILRNMETVAFVIGLAVATRNIFTQS